MDKLMKMADQAASNTESLDESLTLCPGNLQIL